MQSSQEKTSRHIDFIEKNIKKSLEIGLKESLINDYLQVVQEDLLLEKQDEFNLNLNQQDEQENLERDYLINNFSILSENVELNRQKFESLKDAIDTLSIQSIAEKETFKRQQNDRVNKIKSTYQNEFKKVNQELEQEINEYNKIEQELKNQILLENANKNARVFEIKGNGQRRVNDQKNILVQAITEGNAIKHELDNLKAQAEQNRFNMMNKNIMYFQNNNLVQHSNINKPANNYANYATSNNLQDKLVSDKQNLFPMDKHYGQIDQFPQKETPTDQIVSNKYFDKSNERNQILGNKDVNRQEDSCAGNTSNFKPKPFSYATYTDTEDQVELPEQSTLKAKDDESIFMDSIVSDSSDATIIAHPPRKLPKVYVGNPKKRQFCKQGK